MRCFINNKTLQHALAAVAFVLFCGPGLVQAQANDGGIKEVKAFCKGRKELASLRFKLEKSRLDEISSCYSTGGSTYQAQKCEKIRSTISSLLTAIKSLERRAGQADLDQNGVVDNGDLTIIGRCLSEVGAAVDCSKADFNKDGTVTLGDTVVFTAYKSCYDIGAGPPQCVGEMSN